MPTIQQRQLHRQLLDHLLFMAVGKICRGGHFFNLFLIKSRGSYYSHCIWRWGKIVLKFDNLWGICLIKYCTDVCQGRAIIFWRYLSTIYIFRQNFPKSSTPTPPVIHNQWCLIIDRSSMLPTSLTASPVVMDTNQDHETLSSHSLGVPYSMKIRLGQASCLYNSMWQVLLKNNFKGKCHMEDFNFTFKN